MKIAVLIPVYNAERYLRECLDSVLAAGDRLATGEGEICALDIRCCNDGSTDTSESILAEYALRFANVSYVSQANAGVVAARNRLLDELPADCDAFAFVDSDDLVAPETYAVLADALGRAQADVAECGMPGNAVGGEQVVDDMSCFLLRRTAPGPWINVVNKLYRRSAVGAIRFRPGLRFEEDFFFNYEVNAAIRRKVLLPGVFYSYRDNPDSATHALNHERYFESTTRRIRLSLEVFLAAGRIPPELEPAWRAELTKDAYRMCLRKNLKRNRDSAGRRRLYARAGAFLKDLENDFGFRPSGLNPIQRALWAACRNGRYRTGRLLSFLT